MRKIFIPWELYNWIENLSNEDKGILFDYIYRYNLWLECKLDKRLEIVFWFFKPFFDNDIEAYNLFCESRKNNWIKWWRPKKDWNNSQKPKKPTKATKPKKPIDKNRIDKNRIDIDKILYLDYIYLTIEEYNKLIYNYWDNIINKYMNNLNDYIWSKWAKYKSHYFTILSWLNKDWIKKKEHKEPIKVPDTDDFFTSLDKELWQN